MKTRITTLMAMFITCFMALNGNSQTIEWQKCFGGSSEEYARSIQQTSDGGYIVAGETSSNDGDVSGKHGNFDYWIVKLDAAGDTLWTKCLGGSGSDKAQSIQQTNDGGYIVAGHTGSNDGDVSGNHGNRDSWIVKLDAAGDTLWTKCLGGSSSDYAQSIRQTSDGGYIVAGSTSSNDGDVSGNHGNRDYWIVKLDAAGDTLWTKCLGGSDNDYAQSIRQTSDEGYIVAGYTYSDDGDVSGNHGYRDYWIVKLDAAGDTSWTKCFGGSDYDEAYSIQQTTDGGYIVAGETWSNDGDVSGNHGNYDYWIVKLDAAGDTLWTKCLGGSSFDKARSIQQTSDDNYIVAGDTYSNDGDVSGKYDSVDYWIVKLNSLGDTLWTKCLGGSGNNFSEAYSIQQTSDEGYIVAGYTSSNNGDVSGNHGNSDFWIVKLSDSCTTNFNANTTNICEGGTITFSPTCMPDTADYYWDFGAGATPSTATGPGPHDVSYSWHGQFTVSLQVTSQGSTDTIIKTDYISVDSALHIDAASNSPVCTGDTIRLYEYSWESVSWSWTGPDGFTSTQKYPEIPNASSVHQGKYTVIATRANGCSNSDTINISVDTLPYVHAESNSPVCKGDSIYLQETGGEAVSWEWTGPGGFYSTSQYPAIANASASKAGYYIVVGTSAGGCRHTDTVEVVVPSAGFTYSADPANPLKYYFYGQSAGGSEISNWYWDFGDGSTSSDQNPVHTYNTSGTYQACLQIIANGCSDTICKSIDVSPGTDTIVSGMIYAGGNPVETGTVQLLDASLDSAQVPIQTVSIDSGYYIFNHVAENDYKIRAIPGTGYSDDYENTYYGDELYWTDATSIFVAGDRYEKNIHLIPKITECTADFNYSADSNNHFKYSFYDSSVPVDDIISWFWDFDDGYMSSLQNPVHYYSDTGTYHVCLTMQTPYCKDTVCKEIHIGLHTITGTVLAEFERVTHGTVQLFDAGLDSAQTPIETVSIDSGAFIFNNVHPGNYKVRAIPGTESSGNFIPTYYVNKVSWDDAYTIPVHTDIANVVIHLAEKAGTGTRDMQNTANELLVYPNPAGKQLNLEINLQQFASMDIKIMNMTGQTVKMLNTTKPRGTHNISFDVSELKPGMYFGKTILNNEKQMIFRFIKK